MSPTRLALHEDVAVGLQMRARSNPASFGADGRYTSSGGLDQVLEQDLAASARVAGRGQVGAIVPFVQTHRSAGALDDWGGGVGDVALTGRYDFLLASESLRWPGIGVLASATLPTGTPPDRATHLLAADATGNGALDLELGLAVEKISGHLYGAVDAWLGQRFRGSVSVPGGGSMRESFGVRWTAQVVGGYVFDSEAALALYLVAFDERPATVDGVRDASTGLRLTTAGVAGVLPWRDAWRLQGAVFSDVPLASFGRNEPAGYGLTASLVRAWL